MKRAQNAHKPRTSAVADWRAPEAMVSGYYMNQRSLHWSLASGQWFIGMMVVI
jgi:hypothetical protein